VRGAAVTLPSVSTRVPSSSRGIPVDLPGHLGEPLVIRWRGRRRRLEHPDGSELPTDRWGNRFAVGAKGSLVRVRPALGQGKFGHGVFVDDVLVPLDAPLAPRELNWLRAAMAVVAVAGVSLEISGFWLDFWRGPLGTAPVVVVAMVGLLVAYRGVWIAARQLRRTDDPSRRTRAVVTTVGAVLVALGLYAALLVVLL
jgi:hypothetical protein